MPPAFILSQDQTLHERKERPVDSGSTYSKLGSPRATRAGRSAHSIALSGFQGAGRLPERGGRMRCAISGAGLTLSRLKGIASPAGEIFRKKLMRGISAPPGASLPPAQGRAHARQPRTTLSILLPIPYIRVPHGGIAARGAPTRANHALLPPFSSLLPTQRKPTA